MAKQRNVLQRHFYYLRNGYSLAYFPVAILAYASSIYFLYIEKTFLVEYFPLFRDFVLTCGTLLLVGCDFIGYLYFNESRMFKEEQEVLAEANPYLYKAYPGKERFNLDYQIVMGLLLINLGEKSGVVSEEMHVKLQEYISYLKHLKSGGDVRNFVA